MVGRIVPNLGREARQNAEGESQQDTHGSQFISAADYNEAAMRLTSVAVVFVSMLFAAVNPPLPELKVEATDGGSQLRVRNVANQPLTAYLIELVGYPGSSFAFYQEGIGIRTIAPGAEDRILITNMTVGAAPEYVKLQAALFDDGTSAGSAEKVAQLIGLRRTTLETTRELIARLEKGKGGDKAAIVEALRQWSVSIPAPTRRERGTPVAVSRSVERDLISTAAAQLTKATFEEVINSLKASERALALSKPAL